MNLIAWLKAYVDGILHPTRENPEVQILTDEELEELFAATEEEEWDAY